MKSEELWPGRLVRFIGGEASGTDDPIWPNGTLCTVVRKEPPGDLYVYVKRHDNNEEWLAGLDEFEPYVDSDEEAAGTPVPAEGEYTGGSVDYYKVRIEKPTTPEFPPYMAECNDIIEALGMNYAEGNAFKALWRKAAARTLGKHKKGNNALYDAEKVEFFGHRLVIQEKK